MKGVENMTEEFINRILDKFESDLHITKNKDFIGTLFEQRDENIYTSISKSDKYKSQLEILNNINNKIINKFEKGRDIIEAIEEYFQMRCLIEKEMYKYGLYDGMKFIIEGMKNN